LRVVKYLGSRRGFVQLIMNDSTALRTNPSRDYGRHDVRTGAEEFMELREVRELLVELF
jgi:hypothetical protein